MIVVVTSLAFALAGAPDAALVCEHIKPAATLALDDDAAWTTLRATLPDGPVAARARGLDAEHDDPSVARAYLATVAADACTAAVVDTGAAADVAAVLRDPRFTGRREGADALDRLIASVLDKLATLFESEGMAQYATSARAVFLVGLAAAALVLVWRVWRRRRARPGQAAGATAAVLVEARRLRRAEELLRDADAALHAGQGKAALALARAALFARVSDLDRSVTTAMTSRELLVALPRATALATAPALLSFDARFYAGRHDVDSAAACLVEVKRALQRLAVQPA